ncbi:hypothetical protein SUGI_0581830 [Cryptomeria japonica]|uniref:cytochrome P450 82A3 n=1 Tax=Cryptomeria japonica TaxID=3369 RepID=UPI002414BBAC|nr:cytochrome P450 82A3 [Cryptomeria japonica]GLJ29515.1 hypothetical protein SUGI_0581830 [Cryptomeria japonica]
MVLEDSAAAVVAAVIALLVLAYHVMKSINLGKPPHPPSWPIIGHLHLLNKKKIPLHHILYSLSQRYGPVMHLQLGWRPILVVSTSEMAKQCLKTNDAAFASRPRMAGGEIMGYHFKMLGFSPYGAYWRDARKVSRLQLFSAQRINSFNPLRTEEVSSLICSLFKSCEKKGERRVNMSSMFAELMFNIVVRMIASKRYCGSFYSEASEEAQHFKDMIADTFSVLGEFNVGDYLPFLRWLDWHGVEARMKEVQKRRDSFMQTLVNDHREKNGRTDESQVQDLIDVLIDAVDNNQIDESDDRDTTVKAIAIAMVTAGTDTSAVTMEWALASLLQHPEILRKAQEELDIEIGRERLVDESDLPKLKYLEAIVKETFRLYPPGPLLAPHESIEPCSVGGWHVPVGTRLIVNVWAIQRDPAVWDRPTEFDPERFLKSGVEIDVKGQNFELIPFGSGRRMCPAMSVALLSVTYTLARMLQSFEWCSPEGTVIDMTEGFGFTMPRAFPVEAIVKPRLPPHLY